MATKFNVAPALSVPFRSEDATPVVAAYFDAIPYPSCAFFFEVKVISYDENGDGANYWLQGAFTTDAAGVVTQVGSTTVVATQEGQGGMACTIAVGAPADSGSGDSTDNTQIQVTVTGISGVVDWVFDNTIRHAPFSK